MPIDHSSLHHSKEFLLTLWKAQLDREYDSINWAYKLKLIRPHIRIVEVASYWGQWDPLVREIKLSSTLIEKYSWTHVLEILKHEIAHQLVSDRLLLNDGHGPNFQKFCEHLGLERRFRQSQVSIDLERISFESGKNSMSAKDSNNESDRLFTKVQRLLSLSQSSNEHEAIAAMEKVSELYERYNLLRTSERLSSNNYEFILITLQHNKVSSIESLICSLLMDHFFIEVVLSQTYHPSLNSFARVIELYGTPENLKIAEYVYHFLLQKLEELWQNSPPSKPPKNRLQKRSFQLGVLHGFNSRLQRTKEDRIHKTRSNLPSKKFPVPTKDQALTSFVKQRNPRLRKRNQSSRRIHSGAFECGKTQGRHLILNKGIETKGAQKPLLIGPL